MKKLYNFGWDCFYGCVEGIFVAESDDVEAAIGSHLHFGEVLGKHSDVHGKFRKDDIKVISEDHSVIAVIEEHLDGCFGYNPLEYIYDEDDEE